MRRFVDVQTTFDEREESRYWEVCAIRHTACCVSGREEVSCR
ncbi:hypothetical protein CSOJ01_09606 [Colletotrichum sojae]|uniref:Uncharacterized protein n=1 Tax=Colletotrichum sojae TaxID=2175907 RepID=A0A8H6J2J4_9PEZI|nr:hypothetical protein CSOJ01_09606 [Colletotrichum sojae]